MIHFILNELVFVSIVIKRQYFNVKFEGSCADYFRNKFKIDSVQDIIISSLFFCLFLNNDLLKNNNNSV